MSRFAEHCVIVGQVYSRWDLPPVYPGWYHGFWSVLVVQVNALWMCEIYRPQQIIFQVAKEADASFKHMFEQCVKLIKWSVSDKVPLSFKPSCTCTVSHSCKTSYHVVLFTCVVYVFSVFVLPFCDAELILEIPRRLHQLSFVIMYMITVTVE